MGGMSKCLAGGGDSRHPPVGKTLYTYYTYTYYTYKYIKVLCQQIFIYNEEAPCTSHTSCAKVAILLPQDLCVTDICGIYFYLLVQCS